MIKLYEIEVDECEIVTKETDNYIRTYVRATNKKQAIEIGLSEINEQLGEISNYADRVVCDELCEIGEITDQDFEEIQKSLHQAYQEFGSYESVYVVETVREMADIIWGEMAKNPLVENIIAMNELGEIEKLGEMSICDFIVSNTGFGYNELTSGKILLRA